MFFLGEGGTTKEVEGSAMEVWTYQVPIYYSAPVIGLTLHSAHPRSERAGSCKPGSGEVRLGFGKLLVVFFSEPGFVHFVLVFLLYVIHFHFFFFFL